MIKLIDVHKTHINKGGSRVEALKGINLELPSKGFVLLSGDNGSGKTTLLSILGGLDTITSGKMLVNGADYAKYKQKQLDDWRGHEIAFVFQEYNLLSHYTVAENIRLGKELSGEEISDEDIKALLKKVRLEGFENRYTHDMSGGERQKVAVARALVRNPKIILVDEPTAQADEQSTLSLMQILKDISKKILVICVSHKVSFVEKYADRIVELKNGNIVNDKTGKPTEHAKAEEEIELPETHKAFPIKQVMRIGNRSVWAHWGKAVAAITVTMLSLLFFATTIMLSAYDRNRTLADNATGSFGYYVFAGNNITKNSKAEIENLIGVNTWKYIPYQNNVSIIETETLDRGEISVSDYYAQTFDKKVNDQVKIYGKNFTIRDIIKSGEKQSIIFTRYNFSEQFTSTQVENLPITTTFSINEKDYNGNLKVFSGTKKYYPVDGSAGTTGLLLNQGEIIVSQTLYNKLAPNFNVSLGVAGAEPSTYKIKAYDKDDAWGENFILMQETDYQTNARAVLFSASKLLLPMSKVTADELSEIIGTMEEKGFEFDDANFAEIDSFSSKIDLFKKMLFGFAMFSLLFAGVLLYLYSADLIVDRKKDIGILRSMGAREGTVFAIFLTAVSVIALTSFILSAGLSFAVMAGINGIVGSTLGFSATVAHVGAYHILSMLGVCTEVTLVSTFVPILNYSRRSPVAQLKI